MDMNTLAELRTPAPLAIERSRWNSILSAAAAASGDGRPRSISVRTAGSVAVVGITGFIGYKSAFARYYGTELSDLIGTLKDLDRSQAVSAIVLDVDSPGGTVSGTPEAGDAIRRLTKPTIAVANPFAASAAYWLASAADVLLSLGSGEVGSIGVWSMHVDATEWNRQHGFRVSLIASSSEKVELSSDLPLSADARAAVQASVDANYRQFKDAVAKYRGIAPTTRMARMLDSADAAKAGLIDGTIDSLQTAVQLAADLGRLDRGRRQAVVRHLEMARLGAIDEQAPPTRRWQYAMGSHAKNPRYRSFAAEENAKREAELRRLGV